MIFKIQRALNNNMLLIYDKKRKYIAEIEANKELLEFMGDNLKVYAKGKVKDGKIIFSHIVKAQKW